MIQHTLKISAQNQPTVLEKILQATRYRGFPVTSFTMFPKVDVNMLDIEMSVVVAADKSIKHLQLQLDKLYDVNTITVADAAEKLQCQA